MAAHSDFNVPAELDDILDRLPAGLALHVPADLLEVWFPPGVVAGVMEENARKRAEAYAGSCGCTFRYSADLGEGRFHKTSKS